MSTPSIADELRITADCCLEEGNETRAVDLRIVATHIDRLERDLAAVTAELEQWKIGGYTEDGQLKCAADLKRERDAVTAERDALKVERSKITTAISECGIYPAAVIGGDKPYEKRGDYENGWNACAMWLCTFMAEGEEAADARVVEREAAKPPVPAEDVAFLRTFIDDLSFRTYRNCDLAHAIVNALAGDKE